MFWIILFSFCFFFFFLQAKRKPGQIRASCVHVARQAGGRTHPSARTNQ